MRLYFVGGFLGSGKTTAIAGACRLLIARGARVGVVTNDQGKLQVDSLFMRASGFPAVEVGGGCFCCRYDDFDERVASLVETEKPDAVFAESVGSCADIVATVVKPFETLRSAYGAGSVFTVMADSRLLLARLSGRTLPFSEDVLYLFDRQLEEADLLVLNKRDLLGGSDLAALERAAAETWPAKPRLALAGSTEEGAAAWLGAIEGWKADGDRRLIDIDYRRYGSGERELSWLDERVELEDASGLASDGGRCHRAALAFAQSLARGLSGRELAVGHVKLQISAPGVEYKVSLTAGDYLQADSGRQAIGRRIEEQLPVFHARRVQIAVNARVQCSPEELAALSEEAARAATAATGLVLRVSDRSAFRPGMPTPTHSMR
ncbi:MAG TPA: GTP-binding protein [Rectinemataceae bacterium]|nr:GTP-binding protein [Rectinemataceae bacterium]